MSVIVEAGEVVVVVVVVSVGAGVPDADFGFLFCESLVEADLVFAEAAMDEEIEDGGRTRGRTGPLYTGILYVRVCDVEGYEVRYDYT